MQIHTPLRRFPVSLRSAAAMVALATITLSGTVLPAQTLTRDSGSTTDSTETDENIVRVEEDWEVVLDEPSGNKSCPEFHTTMSPDSNKNGYYVRTTWNYREFPDPQPGGIQIQIWNGDTNRAHQNVSDISLSNSVGSATWTQIMLTDGSRLMYGFKTGYSETWGDFGSSGARVQASLTIPHFNQYSPQYSIDNSWVTYGGNRVKALRLKEVRCYNARGTLVSSKVLTTDAYEWKTTEELELERLAIESTTRQQPTPKRPPTRLCRRDENADELS